MVNFFAIAALFVCVVAIGIVVWVYLETRHLPWPKKPNKKNDKGW